MRDAYIPELPADSTAVRITAFIIAAADSSPVLEDQRERADGNIFHVVTQQARVGIRIIRLIIRMGT